MSMPVTEFDDRALREHMLRNDQRAFAEMLRRHRDFVYRLVRAHVGDADDALDVVQESFAAAFAAIERYDAVRPFRPWLARIAINKARDWWRMRLVRRLFLRSSDAAAGEAVADDRPGSERIAADRQQLDLLWRAIARLPASQKEPLILHAIDGLSQKETAAILKISEKAVETRIRRARQRLAAAIDG